MIDQFIHLAAKGTRYYDPKSNKKNFLGGCISFTKKSFDECNGYPNNFWGWGGEDDALLYRSKQNDIDIIEPDYMVCAGVSLVSGCVNIRAGSCDLSCGLAGRRRGAQWAR